MLSGKILFPNVVRRNSEVPATHLLKRINRYSFATSKTLLLSPYSNKYEATVIKTVRKKMNSMKVTCPVSRFMTSFPNMLLMAKKNIKQLINTKSSAKLVSGLLGF